MIQMDGKQQELFFLNVANKQIAFEGIEEEIAERFRQTGQQLQVLQNRVMQLASCKKTDEEKAMEGMMLRAKSQGFVIKMDVYSELLLLSENKRRNQIQLGVN